MNPQIRILIADNHFLFRDGLRLLFDRIEGFEVVCEVNTAIDAVNFSKQLQPDIVLMEIDLPPSNGIEASKEITENNPDTKVIMLTSSEDKNDILNSIRAGATGYLLKGLKQDELLHSINLVATGNVVFDRNITDKINHIFKTLNSCYPSHHFPELTHRENEVLTFVAKGLKNRQIAVECEITEKTVRNHVTNILSKLGASSRGEAISRLQQSCPSF